MCEDCGCGDPELVDVEVHRELLSKNNAQAHHNRHHFAQAGLGVVNLMGSPGAGKTALLEAVAKAAPELRLAAFSGDLATARDAERLQAAGIPARAITTGSACHLDADMVHHALHHLPEAAQADVLVVENVGNLVCPAIYDLGQQANVVALSVTEGEDKPLKYPIMFQHADVVLLTKVDLIPHLDYELSAVRAALAEVAPHVPLWCVSSRSGEGMAQVVAYLRELHARAKKPATAAAIAAS